MSLRQVSLKKAVYGSTVISIAIVAILLCCQMHAAAKDLAVLSAVAAGFFLVLAVLLQDEIWLPFFILSFSIFIVMIFTTITIEKVSAAVPAAHVDDDEP